MGFSTLDIFSKIIAVVPAVILLIYVYRQDKLEKEPRGLLFTLVVFGAISTFIAIVLETIGENALGLFYDEESVDLTYSIIDNFIVVGLSEEWSKCFLLKKRSWKNKAFNCQFDAVVYATFISLGFALYENIGYVAMYGFETGLLRAVTAVPGHASFGVIMGIYYGRAKAAEIDGNNHIKRVNLRRAVWIPAIVHGAYDFFASGSDIGAILFIPYTLAMFIIVFNMVKNASKNDRYFIPPIQQDPLFYVNNNNNNQY